MNRADRLKQANELINYFIKLYGEKFGEKPVLNRHKQRFAVSDVLEDISYTKAQAILRYLVKVDAEPSLTKFCYEYDELEVKMQREKKDDQERLQLRKETEQRVKEFRERYGKNAQ